MRRFSGLVLIGLAVLGYSLGYAAESAAVGTIGFLFEAAFWSRVFRRKQDGAGR
jgi:hypothetical protein